MAARPGPARAARRLNELALPRLAIWAWAWGLLPRALAGPQLEVMYMKYEQQPIDTTPVFDPMVDAYEATIDWKMKYFSVQAKPVPPAVIDNIHLCVQEADCNKQRQNIVVLDFSRPIPVQPGTKVLFEFDVLLQGVVRSYKITVNRLGGSETDIRHMVAQGNTLWPKTERGREKPEFQSHIHAYRCLMDVSMETATMELHLRDGGQTIFASAGLPEPLTKSDSIMKLRNTQPGKMRSAPTRRRLLEDEFEGDLVPWSWARPGAARRLREEAYGEFQYPNKYVEFPVPLGHKRLVSFQVISADGMKRGFYTLELARESCPQSMPLFDPESSSCVRFCNAGFWADHKAERCKKCQDNCLSCLSLHQCIRCPAGQRGNEYMLDNATGTCVSSNPPLWERRPEHAMAIGFASVSVAVFLCGLCAFQSSQGTSENLKHLTAAPHPAAPPVAGVRGEKRAPRLGAAAAQASAALSSAADALRGPAAQGYAKVAREPSF